MRFSTHDPSRLTGKKFVNEPELWKQTEDMVRKVLIDSKIPTWKCRTRRRFTGRRLTCRCGASSAANSRWRRTRWTSPCREVRPGLSRPDNTEKTPLCIHRAPLGTHERFIGFLIEHYAGNFPLWLAPEQVRVLTIGEDEKLVNYAKAIVANCAPTWSAANRDFSNDKSTARSRKPSRPKSTRCSSSAARDMEAGRFRPPARQRQRRREAEGRSRGGHFFASGATTQLRNPGKVPATYTVIYYYTPLTPKKAGPKPGS
jgi:threonyl-tRNA synthetase